MTKVSLTFVNLLVTRNPTLVKSFVVDATVHNAVTSTKLNTQIEYRSIEINNSSMHIEIMPDLAQKFQKHFQLYLEQLRALYMHLLLL